MLICGFFYYEAAKLKPPLSLSSSLSPLKSIKMITTLESNSLITSSFNLSPTYWLLTLTNEGAAERIEEVRSVKEQHLALNVREIARYCISKIQIAIFLFPGMNLQILIGTWYHAEAKLLVRNVWFIFPWFSVQGWNFLCSWGGTDLIINLQKDFFSFPILFHVLSFFWETICFLISVFVLPLKCNFLFQSKTVFTSA